MDFKMKADLSECNLSKVLLKVRGLLGKHSQGFLHFKIVGLENQLVMSISNLGFCETCVCVRACVCACV